MKSIEVNVDMSIEEAEAAVRATLAENGFGVLTEVDIAETLRAKIGVERPPLKILGACNPTLAHRALELDPTVALVLPCNVVLEERASGGTHISAVDPLDLMPGEAFSELAGDAAAKLRAALDAV